MNESALKGTTFNSAKAPLRPRLIVSVEGLDKTGKDHFAFTAPGPIALQATDYGHEGVVQKFQDSGKTIMVANYNRNLPGNVRATDLAAIKEWYEANVVAKFEKDYRAALAAGVRTIVWDTASELWEVMRLSHFGKTEKIMPQMYTAVNSQWQELVRLANDSDTNLIMLHQVKPEWESYIDNKGESKNRTTGKMVRVGNEKIGYLVQAYLLARYVEPKRTAKGVIIEPGYFELEVIRSRHNPDMVGMTWRNQEITFQNVASMLVPELPPETWE